MGSVLVVIGGLPATGKSTVATALALQTATPYLRVDRIEQAIVAWSALSHPLGPVGYAVAHELALEQLQLGLDVIVECVNPLAVTRDGWLDTAATADAALIEVEVICSDQTEHRPGWRPGLPTWRAWPSRPGRQSSTASTSPGAGSAS